LEERGGEAVIAAPMPDYEYRSASGDGSATGTSTAGLLGGALTFALTGGAGFLILTVKKTGRKNAKA